MRYGIIFIIAIMLLVTSCGSGDVDTISLDPTATPTTGFVPTSTPEDDIGSIENIDLDKVVSFPESTVSNSDSDSDGEDDTVTMVFDQQEVAPGLFLDQTVVMKASEDGAEKTMTLEFSGDSDSDYEHVVVLPKTFAEHVDDIEFSEEPDTIIDPDPAFSWIISKMKKIDRKITMKVDGDTMKEGAKGALAQIGTNLMEAMSDIKAGKKVKSSKLFKDVKKSGGIAGLKANFEALKSETENILLTQDLYVCSQKSYLNVDYCLLALIDKHPQWFKATDCNEIYNETHEGGERKTCDVILRKDYGDCENIPLPPLASGPDIKRRERAIKQCKSTTFIVLYQKCKEMTEIPKREFCKYNYAVAINYTLGCLVLEDKLMKQTCLAELLQEISKCESFKGDDRDACCAVIKNSEKKLECLGKKEEKMDMPLSELVITYDPYDDELETSVRYNFSIDYGDVAHPLVYVINWDDDSYITKTFKAVYAHPYYDQGIYEIRVNLTNTTDGSVLASGKLKVETKLPYERLELIKQSNNISISVCGNGKEVFSTGKEYDRPGVCVFAYRIEAEPYWSGRQFSIDFDGQVTDISYVRLRMDGSVNENATELVNINAHYIVENNKTGRVSETKISLSGIPLEPVSQIPKVRRDDYKVNFHSYAQGENVSKYVDHIESSWTEPQSDDPDYSGYYKTPFEFNNHAPPAYLLVVFKSGRVSVNDDPGFYARRKIE